MDRPRTAWLHCPASISRMEWRFKYPFRGMTCWSAQDPAQACLTVGFNWLHALFTTGPVQDDLFQGATDCSLAGYSFDRFMHGRNIHKAQPTIIFSSKAPFWGLMLQRSLNRRILRLTLEESASNFTAMALFSLSSPILPFLPLIHVAWKERGHKT